MGVDLFAPAPPKKPKKNILKILTGRTPTNDIKGKDIYLSFFSTESWWKG